MNYTLVTGFLIGFFVGFFEIFFSNPKVKKLPYLIIIVLRAVVYHLITLLFISSVLIIYLIITGYSIIDIDTTQKLLEITKVYFPTHLNTFSILLIIFLATFVWQLKHFLSEGVLYNYLIGKYHKPSVEERIFMFLDLNNATTIAEKLSSAKFSSFLQDFFLDLDVAFKKMHGQVYQYVGDEVVVIWKTKTGIKNNNCINAYFEASNILKSNKEYYQNKYNSSPSFKASLHIGVVTIAEIGGLKKEISYHGDTINTASRLCTLAGLLGKSFIISKDLYDQLYQDRGLSLDYLGEHELKGKDNKISIYGI